MKKKLFSIILPIHNQEVQLERIVRMYTKSLKKARIPYELLLIVNGSRDNSFLTAKKLAKDVENLKVFNLKEGGWGRAVRFGIKKAKGSGVVYTNSARTDIRDLLRILSFAKKNPDVIIKATRIVRESIVRKAGSTLYNIENRLLFNTPIWDVNGTPKVFPAHVIKKIKLQSEGDLIDAELITQCFRKNIPIFEVPIYNTRRIAGKSTTSLLSAFKMYVGLWELKKNEK